MRLFKTILSAVAIASFGPMAVAQLGDGTVAQTDKATLTAHVKGMVCDFCARAVTKVFGKDEAVAGVDVDLDNGEIHVTLKPGKTLSDDAVERLVKRSGYALIAVKRPGA